ncbi:MAG: hypothetical protein WDO73_18000 [Ignavibacteriota bacterium]
MGGPLVHASTEYDNGVARTLFLGSDGTPFTPEYYENAGRAAIQLLVGPNDLDAIRRRPAIDDGLWARMKDLGQPGIAGLFPGTPAPFLGAITADYSVIMWWADAMAGASQRLAANRQLVRRAPDGFRRTIRIFRICARTWRRTSSKWSPRRRSNSASRGA